MTDFVSLVNDYRPETPVRCPRDGCGWTGSFGELTNELRSLEFASYECPHCMEPVVVMRHLGRAEALMLPWIPKVLRTSGELPSLELAARTRFTWDVVPGDPTGPTAASTMVLATVDGRTVWRELAMPGGFGRVTVVRGMIRARYGAGFGGLAFTARALAWLSGDRTDVARLLGDPPVIATDSASSHEPVTLLAIRITCANGAKFEDPSTALLADLLRERRSDDAYLILERLDGTLGDPFAQAYADDDGAWIVEYRDSQDEPVFHAETHDADLVHTVLVEWCQRLPAWHERLAWRPLDLTPKAGASPSVDDVDDATTDGVVLRDSEDERGTRHLSARLGADGCIEIEGQDLGSGVESAFGSGNTEYEWWWTVRPDDIPAAVSALDGGPGDDVLALLARWSAANNGKDPGARFRDAGVPVEFSNRVGD